MGHWNQGHISWEGTLAHWSALFTNMPKTASSLLLSLLRAVDLRLLIWCPNLILEISRLQSATSLYYLHPSKLCPDQWSTVPLHSHGRPLLRGLRQPGRSSFSPVAQQQSISPPQDRSQAPQSPSPIRTPVWRWRKTEPVLWQMENYLKETQTTTMRLILTQEHTSGEWLTDYCHGLQYYWSVINRFSGEKLAVWLFRPGINSYIIFKVWVVCHCLQILGS